MPVTCTLILHIELSTVAITAHDICWKITKESFFYNL